MDIKIPVPWGHIAGKVWGDEKNTPVLAFHGILDNAGSFDRLIPLLPNSFYYICIDLPGHGLSSHFPSHLPIFSLNYIIAYRLIVKHFKQKRYIIMGHSYGGQIGFLFAQLYPHYVEKLIMLDTITFYPVLVGQFKDYLVDKFESHLLYEDKLLTKEEPTYTYEEAFKKLQFGRSFGDLTSEAVNALLKGSILPAENGKYKFTFDQRLKNFINPLRDFRYTIETMRKNPVLCPIIMILGNESSMQQVYMKSILQELKKRKNVSIKIVDGNHDVHNNHPEHVAKHINKFLLNRNGKL